MSVKFLQKRTIKEDLHRKLDENERHGLDFRVPVIWSKFEFLNYQLEYELTIKITMKNGFRLILALTETRLHHFEV